MPELLRIKILLYAMLALLMGILLLAIRATGGNSRKNDRYCGTVCTVSPSEHLPGYSTGKTLFSANCASCHSKNMKDDLTGPALGGTRQRWSTYPRKDLYEWIRNSQSMIKKGHPRARVLWSKWKPVVMNNFPALTDEQIEYLLLYME